METIVFFLFCLGVGYLMYWTTVNDKRDPNRGDAGWLAIKPPEKRTPEGREPWSPNGRHKP
jgi:hypothetical protein